MNRRSGSDLGRPHKSTITYEDTRERVIVSIPYSGTRYLQTALRTPRCVHTYVPPERLCAYVHGAQDLIVPLRRPEDNWLSWARRWPLGKDFSGCIAEFERSYMGMAWVLKWFKSVTNVHVIKIGEQDTIQNVKRVAEILGVQPALETEKRGSTDEGTNTYDYDVSHLYKYKFVRDNYDRL